MAEHLSKSQVELVSAKVMPEAELNVAAKHLAECATCRQLLEKTVQDHKSSERLAFTVAPEFWIRHDHLEYERLLGYADQTLEATEKEVINLHLSICNSCNEDVNDFLAFREQVVPELDTSVVTQSRKPHKRRWASPIWLPDWFSNPIYATAAVVLGVALIVGAALLLSRRSTSVAEREPTPQASPNTNQERQASNVPPVPNVSPTEAERNVESLITLNDRNGIITVDKNGNVTGMNTMADAMRDEVAQVLLAERIPRPRALEDLRGEDSSLRGTNPHEQFKLISPARTVIVSNRPTLRWEKVAGAISYAVYVSDRAGKVVATGDGLTADRTEWIVPNSLQRGEIYSWTVTAVVEGREVVSPGPSATERRFKVLSATDLRQLNHVRKTRSHLALGIFYADVGMVEEAQQECEQLLRLNPNSEIADKLLRSVKSLVR